jgi:Ca-activated chloride channel homolog
MTVALDQAKSELEQTKGISSGTAKTIKMGAKTQTIKVGGPNVASGNAGSLPSDEEIRKLTGA